jgi:hypothetical protein
MKNLIFIAIFCVSNYGFTQITIDQSDMPSVGDYIPRRSDTMTVLPGPGGSGPNFGEYQCNFSSLHAEWESIWGFQHGHDQ